MKHDHHTFLGELITGNLKGAWQDFTKFLGAGEDVATALQKGWDTLGPALKDALVNGSGIINEIAADFNKIPADIIKAIQEKFPALPLDKVKEVLQKIQGEVTQVDAIPADTLEQTIANLQAYFAALKGSSALSRILSQAAQTIASFLSPTSEFGKIVTYIELAFRLFVKP